MQSPRTPRYEWRTSSARTEAAKISSVMPAAPIAGPRRTRATDRTTALSAEEGAPARPGDTSAGQARPGASVVRALVPLDYDEMRPSVPARQATSSTSVPRKRGGLGWFVLGIAFGAVTAVLVTGEAEGTLRSARAWSGRTLRSLEHRPVPVAPTLPVPSASHLAEVASVSIPAMTSTPCPVDPGPGDPCFELLAPFATTALDVPTVPVEDLPRVKPPPPPAVLRARAAVPVSAPPATTTAQDRSEAPHGINPDGDDSQATPVKSGPAPTTPGPDTPGPDPAGTANAPT
jgi:hypothetical protein